MATATKAKPKTKPQSTALATQVKELSKNPKADDFVTDLRTIAKKNGKALADIEFGEILKQLADEGELESASELGNGFAILNSKEKARLCGVPILILDWNFNDGDNGEFVSVTVLTNSERIIVNDGSTGIYQQLRQRSDEGNLKAIYAKHGLRESKYEYEDPKTGEKKPASTFYIDVSA